jgi:DNA-binding beta-propeller fold protein YncE
MSRNSAVPAAAYPIVAILVAGCMAREAPEPELGPPNPVALPTGQQITPTLPPFASFAPLKPGFEKYPDLAVGGAVTEALSPDGATLAILTTGYNRWNDPASGKRNPELQSEYVFLFDIATGKPIQKQVLTLPNTWAGLAFSPDSKSLYVSGGVDDTIHTFVRGADRWVANGDKPIALSHAVGNGPEQKPLAAGIAVTADGRRIVVANMYNDSISIVDPPARKVVAEIDLRPGKSGGTSGAPGGNYPYWIAIRGNDTAYVSSVRDREIVVVDLVAQRVRSRVKVAGNPNKMILDKAGRRLFVAMDNADAVAVIDTASGALAHSIGTVAPAGILDHAKGYGGAAPNSLALSRDEATLYVSNGGTNAIAVIALDEAKPRVKGLIPTGWYPQHVVFTPHRGGMLHVVNSKSVPGPNPGFCSGGASRPCFAGSPIRPPNHNQYVLQLSKSGFQSMPVPTARGVLAKLTRQVADNNTFHFAPGSKDEATIAFLRQRIKHVIYIVRENRTYDQVLGDLGRGNSDPNLAEFGAHATPNQHALARALVTLDNFYDPAEVSGNGWPWSTSGRESDFGVKMLPPNYARRGGSYEWEGENRNVGMGVVGPARAETNPKAPTDPDFLPGTGNVASSDGPGGELQQGYLWSAVLRAGKTVRNYGFFVKNIAPREREAFSKGIRQAVAIDPELVGRTDEYFRGYDVPLPDTWRQAEWEREFRQFVENGNLPALSLVRFGSNHTGAFAESLDGVDTPELQVAANDLATGRLVEAVAKSRYAKDTLIFVVEDDCQDGPDHVDEHRSIASVVGPYVKRDAVVSTRYSTVNMLRTIEDILGIDHISLYTATQPPMTDVFDLTVETWDYTAIVPDILRNTKLPLPPATGLKRTMVKPTQTADYWIAATKGLDFSKEDVVDAETYNRILWRGLMGTRPYPERR